MAADTKSQFNQQFERSGPASPPSSPARERVQIDGASVMGKYAAGDPNEAKSMSGAEMYAILGHLKEGAHADGVAELEKSLLKLRRQPDKKIHLMEWVIANVGAAAPPKPLANIDSNARPTTAPSDGGASIKRKMEASRGLGAMQAPGEAAETPRGSAAPTPRAGSLAHADAIGLVEQFALSGRDHLSMNGAELHGLVQWLQNQGHSDIEDLLLKVRSLGDKKFHLCQYLKTHAETLSQAPAPVQNEAPSMAATMHQPAPAEMMMMEAPPQQQMQQLALTMPPAPAPAWEAPLAAAPAEQLYAPAPMASNPPTARSGGDRALVQHVMMLGQTLDRMEETFNFQVDCMREDMKKAREQLHMLNAALSRR